jgi:hypothetical protein
MKSFSERFEDSDLGITSEPLDVDPSPGVDLAGGDAFKPTEILRSASFRYKAEPNLMPRRQSSILSTQFQRTLAGPHSQSMISEMTIIYLMTVFEILVRLALTLSSPLKSREWPFLARG